MRCGIIAVTAIALLPRPARADLSAQLYEDVKGMIVELATADVATNIVPQIVCRAGHVIDNASYGPSIIEIDKTHYRFTALDHFPRTLQALYSRQFGGLKSAILSEVADLAAYRVLVAFRDPEAFQPDKVGQVDPQQLNASFSPTPRVATPAIVLDRLGVLKTGGQVELGDLAKVYDGPTTFLVACKQPVKDLFETGRFGAPRATRLEQQCAQEGEHLSCDLALGLRSMLAGQPDAAERHVTRAVARIVAGVVANQLSVANAESLVPKLAALMTTLAASAMPADLLTSLANDVGSATAEYATLAEREPRIATATQTALEKLVVLEKPLRRLMTEWQTVAASHGRLDVGSFVDRILATQGGLYDICQLAKQTAPCKEIGKVARMLTPGGPMWPLLQAANRNEIRTVAEAVVGSVFSARRQDACKDRDSAACQQGVFPRFATALALYVIDAAETGATADTTRAAFRAAAVEVIRSLQPRGYTRSWLSRNIVYPDFGLRLSWNAGYVSDDGSSFRYAASSPLLSFRPPLSYTERAYVAAHVSLLDPLAALSELALRRNNVDFHDSDKVLWNAITPRLDIVFGLPSLSSHLLVGFGGSLRVVVPIDTTSSDSATRVYTYRSCWQHDWSWSRALELGFAIKYML